MSEKKSGETNILIVDDSFTNRLFYSTLIKNFGYNCIQAANGKEAIEKIENQKIDIVLMDIEMPVMNGIDATKYIREKLKPPKNNTLVFALTAHSAEEFTSLFKDHEMFSGLIEKPITKETLERIAKLL